MNIYSILSSSASMYLTRYRNLKKSAKHLTVLTLLLLIALPSLGGQLYRYKDDQGNYVLDHTIPPQFVPKGYEILNSKGRVIKTIAPALTPEQIIARDAALEQERLRQIEKEKQDAIDAELKQLYSHPDDAIRVLNRQLSDIEGLIELKKGQISATRAKILQEESKAAKRQRKGLRVDESILEKISKFKSDITNNNQDIEELLQERKRVDKEFSEIVERLELITGTKASIEPKSF